MPAGSRYVALATAPGVLRVGLPSILARLPLGMTTLAILLAVQQATGSFGAAGTVTGCFALATGVASPVRGRLVDRVGATPVLLTGGLLQPLALVALAVTVQRHAPVTAMGGAAVVAGVLLPPAGPVTRTIWQRILTRADLKQAAFSLDAVILQVLNYAAGPPLVSVLVMVGSPVLALWVIAGLTVLGAIGVALAPPARRWPAAGRRAPLLGPLVVPAVWSVLVLSLLSSAAIAALEVGMTAFASAAGARNLSGLLLALLGIGSIAGGLWQGSRTWTAPLPQQYSRWLAVLAVGVAPLLLAPNPAVLGALAVVAGIAIAPTSTLQFTIVGWLAPEHTVTEAFTWLFSVTLGGAALGSAAGGAIAQADGPRMALLLAVLLAGLAALISLGGMGRRGRPSRVRRYPAEA